MAANGYNFTNRIRSALMSAREEAARLRHEYVGTEHVLLGIIADHGTSLSVGQAMLDHLAINSQEVRQTIEEIVKYGKGSTKPSAPDIPYTSRAKKVLELAMRDARETRDDGVDTGHLLIGLLAEGKGIAADVLSKYRVTLPQLRELRRTLLTTSAIAEVLPHEESVQHPLLQQVRAAFKGQNFDQQSRLTVVADLDALPPPIVAELLASLDMLHRAWGGAGLVIERQATGSCVAESVVSQ